MNDESHISRVAQVRLNGWKQIAAHLGRSSSTVRRWAAEAGLPIYRPHSGISRKGAAVYALLHELDAWLVRYGSTVDAASPAPAANGTVAKSPENDIAAPRPPLLPHTTEISAQAQRLYLQGAYLWQKRTVVALTEAESRLRAAIDMAPDFAAAHAELAIVYNLMADYEVLPVQTGYRLAGISARRALDLNPRLARAYTVLGDNTFYGDRRFDEALDLLQRATECDPTDGLCCHWYGAALTLAGRPDEGAAQLMQARVLHPESRLVLHADAMNLLGRQRFDEARDLLADLIENEPGFSNPLRLMAFVEFGRGNLPGYIAAWHRHFVLRDDATSAELVSLAISRPAANDPAGLARFLLDQAPAAIDAYLLAHLHMLAGDWARAIDGLARVPDCTGFYNAIDPVFFAARTDARFRDSLREVQLPA